MTESKIRNMIISRDRVNEINSNNDTGIVIYGAGGHALVIADMIALMNRKVYVFFDDEVREENKVVQQYNPLLFRDAGLIIGIGNNTVRERITHNVKHSLSLIHI